MDLLAIVPRIPPPIVTLMRPLISTSLQRDGMGDSTILAASDRSLGAVRCRRLFGPLPGTYRLATRHRPRRTRVRPRSHGWVSRRGRSANPQPSNGAKKHCPFCTGYASFQFAAIGSPTIVIPPQIVGGDVLAIEDDMALRKSAITPQSRGPPTIPV